MPHTPATARLPMAAAATVLALMVSACANGVDGSVPVGEETAETLDPADGASLVASAIETVTGASSYEVVSVHLHESAYEQASTEQEIAFWRRHVTVQYNGGKIPAVIYTNSGEGGYSAAYRSGDDPVVHGRMDSPVRNEDPPEAIVHMTDFAAGAHKLNEIASTSGDLVHQGPEILDGEHHTIELFPDRMGEPEHDWSEAPAEGHRYTGTFTASYYEVDSDSHTWLLKEEPGVGFVLWISEEGRPLELEYVAGDVRVRTRYASFDEPVRIDPLEPTETEPVETLTD